MPQPTVWRCGHCHTGPMRSHIDTRCLYCGQVKDEFSADGPADNPRNLELKTASLPQPVSQRKRSYLQNFDAPSKRKTEEVLWFCGLCGYGPMTDGVDTHCISCGSREDDYAPYHDPQTSTSNKSSPFTQRSKPPPMNTTISHSEAQIINYASPIPLPLGNFREDIGPFHRNLLSVRAILRDGPWGERNVRADDPHTEGAEESFQDRGHRQEGMVVPDPREFEKDKNLTERVEPANSRPAVSLNRLSAVEEIDDLFSDEITIESAYRMKVPRSVVETKIQKSINDSFGSMGTVEGGTKTNKDKALKNNIKTMGKEVYQGSAIWPGRLQEGVDAPPNEDEDLLPQFYDPWVKIESPNSERWTDPFELTSDGTERNTLEDAADVNEPENSISRKSEEGIYKRSHQLREPRSNVYVGWLIWVGAVPPSVTLSS